MPLFMGTVVNKIDKKGRVSVPAPFRAALSDQAFAGIIAYRSFTTAAIEGCGMDFMERLSESTEQFDVFSAEQDDLTSLIFADARQLAWDDGGRIVLPEDLIEHAGLSDAAAFVGKGRTFQVWEPEAFKASQEEARRRAMEKRPTLPLRPRTPAGGQ
ncbi:division/cell wall cluster transcriptional repressor MraZ [Telmatospirillum sp. J64-1]|uniref:division/cell wall cluster transcriptional repressor MraZ n=1 Tax=Telmatospirillum sp. J64-1 TaxID=2502183 RepID=UPI00115E82BB|nr:division/cell wall cluster transcriptional repressor MraZ [Telmatospirillum sp. J64-1]